jgi:hypothetical protein
MTTGLIIEDFPTHVPDRWLTHVQTSYSHVMMALDMLWRYVDGCGGYKRAGGRSVFYWFSIKKMCKIPRGEK